MVFLGHEGWVQSLCFSVDGYLLASSADDDMVKLWDVAEGRCLKTLEGKTESSSHCGFHPTGALIVSGSSTPVLGLPRVSTNTGDSQQGKPPHVLNGEEILSIAEQDGENVKKPRARSAQPLRGKISFPGLDTPIRVAPKSAGVCRPVVLEEKPKPASVTVEQWLTTSFQRL